MLKFLIIVLSCAILIAGEKYNLVKLDSYTSQGAVCLDGSPAAYHYRMGSVNKMLIFFEGGGWCYGYSDDLTIQSCIYRSFTHLGSSKELQSQLDLRNNGILSDLESVTPSFYNWHAVYVHYCDGTSFSGDLEEPIMKKDDKIYFRGKRVLNAVINHLLNEKGLKNMDELVISGGSAGGLTTYLHTDHIAAQMPSRMKVSSIPDCGFFLDSKDTDGRDFYRTEMTSVFTLSNGINNLNQRCMNSYSSAEKWKCIFPMYFLNMIQTRVFLINSLYDTWSLANIVRLDCSFPDCSEQELSYAHDYRQLFIDVLESTKTTTDSKRGYWLDSCGAHGQGYVSSIYNSRDWQVPMNSGITISKAVVSFMNQEDSKHVDTEPWPFNAPCAHVPDKSIYLL